MEPVIHPHQLECGRIFINFYNRNELIIKCFYCRQSFGQWTHFVRHVHTRHTDLKRSHNEAKTIWKTFDQGNDASATESPYRTEEDDYEAKCIEEEACADWKRAEEANFEEEFADNVTNLEYAEVDEDENSFSISSSCTVPKDIDAVTNDKGNDSSLLDTASEHKRPLSFDEDTCDFLSIGYAEKDSDDEPPIKLAANIYSSDQEGSNFENTKSKRTFYNLRSTPADIMLEFIELVHQHPCQWNPDDEDYDFRDKRIASATEISLELKKRWGIEASPQLARTSVLQLCRWFEQEYLRSINQPKNSKPYVSRHQDYYMALLSFLPHSHLKVTKCDRCPRQFKSEAQLVAHKFRAHNGEMPFKCQYCGRGFRHSSTLRNHEYRHKKLPVWKCGVCNYECAMKADIRIHMASHSDERAFVCEVCGGAYKSSTSLNVHRRTHKPPKLECHLCGKMFHENYRLKSHILKQHNTRKRKTPMDVRCDICLRKFTSLLRMHNHKKHKHAFLVNTDEAENEIDTYAENTLQ